MNNNEKNMVLKIDFENCFGIKKLKKDFNLKEGQLISVYSKNGIMKTSFAKVFHELKFQDGSGISDRLKPSLKTLHKFDFLKDDKKLSMQIEVFSDFNKNELHGESLKSVLLTDQELATKYKEKTSKFYNDFFLLEDKIKEKKGSFGKESRTNNTLNDLIERYFPGHDFLSLFERLKKEKKFEKAKKTKESYPDLILDIIYSSPVKNFLKKHKDKFKEFSPKYRKLILEQNKKNKYFNESFNLFNLKEVYKSLKNNNFFKYSEWGLTFAGTPITETKLENIINSFEEEIVKMAGGATIISALSANKGLIKFHKFLEENRWLMQELNDWDKLIQNILIDFFIEEKKMILNILEQGKTLTEEIKNIKKIAEKQKTTWEDVVVSFNSLFTDMPFIFSIANKSNAVLGGVPIIEFHLKEKTEQKTEKIQKYSEDFFVRTLSNGENKALYVLRMMYKLKVKENKEKTLIIFDDIVDSFDYKNKYAFIRFLKHQSTIENFYLIFLTHSFDFFRTLSEKTGGVKNTHFIAIKNEKKEIEFVDMEEIERPYDWEHETDSEKKLIYLIALFRNILEFCGKKYKKDYKKLTAIFHLKKETQDLTVYQVIDLINKKDFFKFEKDDFKDKNIIDFIFEVADGFLLEKEIKIKEIIKLRKKIIYSVAIRLKMEFFIKEKIGEKIFFKLVEKNTSIWSLIEKNKNKFSFEEKNFLEDTQMLTSEYVHFNSFAYESMIDTELSLFSKLYKEASKLYKH